MSDERLCTDCHKPATGDYPGLGLKCDDCRRAIRRAASKFTPIIGGKQ